MSLSIANRAVGPGQPLFTIAEIGLNHGGSIETALALVDAAAVAGASAIKLQSLRADTLVAPSAPAPAHVNCGSLREFFRQFELDAEAHRALAGRARASGLAFISTPFDEEMVDLLVALDCDAFKIASGDLTHARLISRVARTGRPLIISTGMASLAEVSAAVRIALEAGANEIALLHCVSAYPVPAGQQNLRAISELRRTFGVPVGLSDHGTNRCDLAAAVALGASLYEKHLMLDGDEGQIDAPVSVTPAEFAALVRDAEHVRKALGDGRKTCQPAEGVNVVLSRRSLCAARPLRVGDIITEDALLALRPATGLHPGRWRELIGQRVTRDLDAGAPFIEDDLAHRAETRISDVA
jgi:N-acetylneuraminate synthase